jgi:uncharacterized protein YcaQ
MHYHGVLRVARRSGGIRLYAAHVHTPGPADAAGRRLHVDALVDLAVQVYAPVPSATLSWLVNRLRYAAPQWTAEFPRALKRAKARLAHAHAEGTDWYWPALEGLPERAPEDLVRFLAPFDPVVWDRRRFALLWGWAYRFEAYTPAPLRKLGYYALPLLWRDRIIGWGNLSVANGELRADLGYVAQRPPRERVYTRELEAEFDRLRVFLGL